MSQNDIKEGDVVRLKSGSLPMTVAKIDTAGVADCVWTDGKEHLSKRYSLIVLEKDDPSDFPYVVTV